MEIVDAELIEDKQYAAMGKNPANRIRALLGKLGTMRRSQEKGSDVSGHSKLLSNKSIGQVEKIFKNLPKPMEWLSFLNNDLPILMDFCEEVQRTEVGDRRVTAHVQRPPNSETGHFRRDSC